MFLKRALQTQGKDAPGQSRSQAPGWGAYSYQGGVMGQQAEVANLSLVSLSVESSKTINHLPGRAAAFARNPGLGQHIGILGRRNHANVARELRTIRFEYEYEYCNARKKSQYEYRTSTSNSRKKRKKVLVPYRYLPVYGFRVYRRVSRLGWSVVERSAALHYSYPYGTLHSCADAYCISSW